MPGLAPNATITQAGDRIDIVSARHQPSENYFDGSLLNDSGVTYSVDSQSAVTGPVTWQHGALWDGQEDWPLLYIPNVEEVDTSGTTLRQLNLYLQRVGDGTFELVETVAHP